MIDYMLAANIDPLGAVIALSVALGLVIGIEVGRRRPMARGRWLEKPDANVIVCSKCGEPYFYAKKYNYSFCPSCGAKMSGEINTDEEEN